MYGTALKQQNLSRKVDPQMFSTLVISQSAVRIEMRTPIGTSNSLVMGMETSKDHHYALKMCLLLFGPMINYTRKGID